MLSTDPQPTTEPSAPQPARDYRQEVTDNIIHLLEQGVAPWQKPWEAGASLGMPMNPTTGKAYRGGNAIHLMTTGLRKGYSDPRWMTTSNPRNVAGKCARARRARTSSSGRSRVVPRKPVIRIPQARSRTRSATKHA